MNAIEQILWTVSDDGTKQVKLKINISKNALLRFIRLKGLRQMGNDKTHII